MTFQGTFSGLVVAYNEEQVISGCLKSLAFCDEIILIDLGSVDKTVAIAKELKAKVISHPWVPIGEQARQFGISKAKHDWVVIIDPDERISPTLPEQLWDVVQRYDDIGMVAVRWEFYVKGKKLTTTRWGFVKKVKSVLFHKSRVEFGTKVHSPYVLKGSFREHRIDFDGTNSLTHLWVTSYSDFIKKHWKYIKMEGEAQYTKGIRFSAKGLLYEPLVELKKNLLDQKGLQGGVVGIFLSLFRWWYLVMRELSLANYQYMIRKKK